jgi:hypothetical protein
VGNFVRILIACEFSGVVRRAFRALGHDAWSCDLLPSEDGSEYHIHGDVMTALYRMPRSQAGAKHWDLMVAHPPCTYLANSGERWLKDNPDRQLMRKEALSFVLALWNAPIERIAIENPIGHLSTAWQKPHQVVQPFLFGHPEWKSTCLWLKNLPPLHPTHCVEPDGTVGGGKKPGRISSRLHRLPPGPDRQRERSRTFQGVADAMAAQWGGQRPIGEYFKAAKACAV